MHVDCTHVGCTHVSCTHVGLETRIVNSQCYKEGYKWFRFTLCCYLRVRLILWLCRVCTRFCALYGARMWVALGAL